MADAAGATLLTHGTGASAAAIAGDVAFAVDSSGGVGRIAMAVVAKGGGVVMDVLCNVDVAGLGTYLANDMLAASLVLLLLPISSSLLSLLLLLWLLLVVVFMVKLKSEA